MVQRKQSHFDKLRSVLLKLYPGYSVPALPKKRIKDLEEKTLNKRKEKLLAFLDELIKHPVFSSCKMLNDFLSASEAEYEKKEAAYIAQESPKEISNFTTIEGMAETKISANDETLSTKIKETSPIIKSISLSYIFVLKI